MTLEELRKLRGNVKSEIEKRDTEGKTIEVIVGMGTCGIASGAKETFNAFVKEIDARGMGKTVLLRQTGCMGMCANEPTVEVVVPGMPRVIYGNVKADIAKDIVEQHLVGHKLLDKLILDRPAADIITNK